MKLKFIKKIRQSVSARILVLVILTGAFVNFIVGAFIQRMIFTKTKEFITNNSIQYANYLIEDLGTPPNFEKAKQISKRLSIQINFSGKTVDFKTSKLFDQKRKYRIFYQNKSIRIGRRKSLYIIQLQKPVGTYTFIFQFFLHDKRHKRFFFAFILFLTLIFVLVYFKIRKILKPLRSLKEGVNQIQKGNLDHQIKVKRKDELGLLASSFNHMTKDIKNMISAKHQLLLDVSHELRSPLTRMRVAIEFLDNDKLKADLEEELEHMSLMIKEILESERLDSPYGRLNLKKVNLKTMIKDVIELFEKTDVPIHFNQQNDIYLFLDEERIKTVFSNVIQNAIKYSSDSKKPIEVSYQIEDQNVKIQIKDYGIGIPEKDLPFILEPFYRVDKSRTKETGGFGLGLSLCKKIINAHQGQFNINSTLQKGTTILILLPVE